MQIFTGEIFAEEKHYNVELQWHIEIFRLL